MSADIQVMPSIHSKQDAAPPNFASSLTPRSRAFLKVISVLGSRTSTMVKPRTLTNDAGWTTIKTGGGKRGGRGARRDETALHLSDVDRDVGAEQLDKEYTTVHRTLQESRFFTESLQHAKANIFKSLAEATGVVALGLGSLVSLNGWKTTMFQIAYLEELLAASGLSSLPKYVQDPVMKDADVVFLKSKGYTILEHPAGFDSICENTFVYAPHLENTHTQIAFDREPLAMLCNDVSMWTDILSELELAKFPTLKTVVTKYSAYELPFSEEVSNGRVFNNLVFYFPLRQSTESNATGIRLKITPATEPQPRISPIQEKKEFSLQKGERNFLKPEKWVARPSFALKVPSPKAFRLRALKSEENPDSPESPESLVMGEGENSLFMRRRKPERVNRPSFVPPPVVRSNGERLQLRGWEASTARPSVLDHLPSPPTSPASPDRFERFSVEKVSLPVIGYEKKGRRPFPSLVLSSCPTPLPNFEMPDTPRDLPLVLPVVPTASTPVFPFFPSLDSSLLSCSDSNETINGLRQLLPAPKPKSRPNLSAIKVSAAEASRPTNLPSIKISNAEAPLPSPRMRPSLAAIKTDLEEPQSRPGRLQIRPSLTAIQPSADPLPSPRLGRLELRNNSDQSTSPNGNSEANSLLARRAAKRSSSVPLMLTTTRNHFDIAPPPSPMTATFGTKDILEDHLPSPPPSPRPQAKALKLVLPPKSPPRNTSVPIPNPLVDPLYPSNHSASRAADNLRNFSRGSRGWRSGLASRRHSG